MILRKLLLSMRSLCQAIRMPLPFNMDILSWANETREILSRARGPPSVKFYNIYGTSLETPHSVCYGNEGSPIQDLELLRYNQLEVQYFHNHATVTSAVTLNKNPVVDLTATLGTPAIAFGVEAGYDTPGVHIPS